MKRSRIFLGATSALLAIAGVAAAKMSHFASSVTRYYCTHIAAAGSRICVPYSLVNCQSQFGGVIPCYFTVQFLALPYYTLYTNGPSLLRKLCGSSGNCTIRLLYSTFE
jgi:hypothetical protein